MHSPRRRWNWVAQQEGKDFQRDGLYSMSRPDQLAKDLQKLVKGKSSDKALNKVFLWFQSPSNKLAIEAMLFATLDHSTTSKILGLQENHVKLYADCFFDISVFQDDGDRQLYLDRYSQIDMVAAQMMRNAFGTPPAQLKFLADQKKGEKVSPKDALEEGLRLFYNLMKVYIRPQLEDVLLQNPSPDQEERVRSLFQMGRDAAKELRGFTDQLLKYELDKSSENFLEEFALAIQKLPREDIFLLKDEGPELI